LHVVSNEQNASTAPSTEDIEMSTDHFTVRIVTKNLLPAAVRDNLAPAY